MAEECDVVGPFSQINDREGLYVFNFPAVSMIRVPKLLIHSIILLVTLTFISLFVSDMAGWYFGKPIEFSSNWVTWVVVIWAFFAVQSNRYTK